MSQREPTMKTLSKDEARQQFDQLISEVANGETSFTIEDDGKPVAVVLPFDQDARRRAARGRVMTTLGEMQDAASASPEEAEELAREAVKAARAESDRFAR